MHALILFARIEVLLLVLMLRKIRYNEQLLAEIKRCQLDLVSAMHWASQGRYEEARGCGNGLGPPRALPAQHEAR
jgi:hypothetical protein